MPNAKVSKYLIKVGHAIHYIVYTKVAANLQELNDKLIWIFPLPVLIEGPTLARSSGCENRGKQDLPWVIRPLKLALPRISS